MSLAIGKPCIPLIKQELYHLMSKCILACTIYLHIKQERCDACKDIHSATQQLPKTILVWK